MQEINISVLLTSYNEPVLVTEALSKLVKACNKYSKTNNATYEIIVMAGDLSTYNAAQNKASELKNTCDIKVINDGGQGKPNALNLAVQNAKYDYLIFTDGDVYVDENSITNLFVALDSNTAAVSGHPVSVENKTTIFGYFSHLFCEAANNRRLTADFTPMSGYLFLLKKQDSLFPIPVELRAEDAYISAWLQNHNQKITYAKDAYVYVRFPKNASDWIKQKSRSLGGNIQLSKFTANLPHNQRITKKRSILQDLSMLLFPIKYAKNPRELAYSLILYPLRFYLWIKIYIKHFFNRYQTGRWETIKSSKI